MLINGRLSIVRGGGDIATGIIYRLWKCGFKVLALEISKPLVVRRTVSVASAVFSGKCTVDGMPAALVSSPEDVFLSIRKENLSLNCIHMWWWTR